MNLEFNITSNLLHTKESLKKLYDINAALKEIKYPGDSIRIAKEILEFSDTNQAAQTNQTNQTVPISIDKIISRLKNNEPWEYIRQEAEFCGQTFYVDKNVLIPRIETEQLVQMTIDELKFAISVGPDSSKNDPKKAKLSIPEEDIYCLEIGTGSGAIIVSVANSLNQNSKGIATEPSPNQSQLTGFHNRVKFVATDISAAALNIAKKNSHALTSTPVEFIHSDLLKNVPKQYLAHSFVLIANLPYIPEHVYNDLQPQVKEWEPRHALVGGSQGHEIYEELFKQIAEIITHEENSTAEQYHRVLLIEIDPSMKNATTDSIKEVFPKEIFPHTEFDVKNDCNGQERFIRIKL